MSDNMLVSSLRVVLERDLRSLEDQIAAYPDDESLWKAAPGISNSGGNLALHLTGNLRHFIGAILGESRYVRDRPAEFATRDLSREVVVEEIRDASREVIAALDKIDGDQLGRAYPLPLNDKSVLTADFLVHLAVHLTYHLGQIDYHRRLLTSDPASVENVSIKAIPAVPSA